LEDPGVGVHRDIVSEAGLGVAPAPVDSEGVTVDAIDRADAVVVTPAHQYPLGPMLSPSRRASLMRWAQDRGGYVVEDDFDGEFRFDRQAAGAVQGLDPTRVVYAGTSSKSIATGLRIGWLVVPPDLVEPVVDRLPLHPHVSAAEQLTLARFIESGRFDRHVRRVRQQYRRRREALLALVARWPIARTTGMSGGLHATIQVPDGTEDALVAAAAARSLALAGLRPCWQREPRFEGLVVGYSRPPAHAWEATLEAFGASLRDVLGPATRR
jgi:GntR family transcriptional regulator/MocR family aminotransferase